MACAKNKLFIKETKLSLRNALPGEMLAALRGTKGEEKKLAMYRKIDKEIDHRLDALEKLLDEASGRYHDAEEFWSDFEEEMDEILGEDYK